MHTNKYVENVMIIFIKVILSWRRRHHLPNWNALHLGELWSFAHFLKYCSATKCSKMASTYFFIWFDLIKAISTYHNTMDLIICSPNYRCVRGNIIIRKFKKGMFQFILSSFIITQIETFIIFNNGSRWSGSKR